VAQIVTEICARPFRDGEPMFRATVIGLRDRRTVLAAAAHHAVFDGGSRNMFMTDLEAAYRGGTVAPEGDEWWAAAEQPVAPASLAYWSSVFATNPPPLDLSTRTRPRVFTGVGARLRFDWTDRLPAMQSAAVRMGCTVSSLLIAGFAALARLRTAQDDIVVATAFSGRHRRAVADRIGMYVRTLPLRIDARGDQSWTELVRQVNRRLLEALEYSDCGFDQIVAAAGLERDPSRPPLAQVMVSVDEEEPAFFASTPGIDCLRRDVPLPVTRFDMSTAVTVGPERLVATVEYGTDLFSEEEVQALVGQWELLLDAAYGLPDHAITGLGVMEAEPQREREPEPLPLLTGEEGDASSAQAGDRGDEQRIALIIMECMHDVLGEAQFGLDDNFFDEGGTSLDVIKVVARIISRGLTCTVRDVYYSQTPYELARTLTVAAAA
jgi:hypothetical protein